MIWTIWCRSNYICFFFIAYGFYASWSRISLNKHLYKHLKNQSHVAELDGHFEIEVIAYMWWLMCVVLFIICASCCGILGTSISICLGLLFLSIRYDVHALNWIIVLCFTLYCWLYYVMLALYAICRPLAIANNALGVAYWFLLDVWYPY